MSAGLTVVVPAWNEEKRLAVTVEEVVAAARRHLADFEVIVVDDGSTDGTREIVEDLMATHGPRVRLAVHPVNRGYGAALRTGVSLTRYDLVFYTDADNQFDPGDLKHFLPLIDEYDLVVGFRVYRYDTMLRSVLSWIYNKLVSVLFRVRVRDVDCAFKLFRREVLEKVTIECDDFFVDTELVAKARRWNFRLLEKGVRHYPRMAGETTVQPSHILRTLATIATMWRRTYLPSPAHRRRMASLRALEPEVGVEVVPGGRAETPGR